MNRLKAGFSTILLLAGIATAAPQTNATGSAQTVLKNTPGFVSTAKNLGPENASDIIQVSLWLNVHNKTELDSLAAELYDKSSGRYRQWLKPADFEARFAPTDKEALAVEQSLRSHGLSIVSRGPSNMYVRAQGSVAAVQSAFRVTLDNFEVNGQTVRSNTNDPTLDPAITPLVSSISGLSNAGYQHPLLSRSSAVKSPQTKNADKGLPLATPADTSSFFSSVCFTGPETLTFVNPYNGGFPIGRYNGNGYFSDPNSPGCGYTPQNIWAAYNLNPLYKAGFDGTGQTIVIIDWCGSPTVRADANAFSARFGLPPLTDSNFKIYNYPGPSTCSGEDVEINLDVEWAHAIAPGAKIALVVPPSATFDDTNAAQLWAEYNQLGNVISGSYGSLESFTPTSELITINLLNELASVLGISANFSSGDTGDFTPYGIPATVSNPASSPYATAVGGVTLALNADNSIKFQAGWGNNETELVGLYIDSNFNFFYGYVLDPPINFGFYAGSGGGPSGFYLKPSYQKNLPGKFRHLPDISWLADPFTGGVIAITLPGVYPQAYVAIGGTSLSCPMFSALWAIANQEAGVPLGQAAPYLYAMPSGTITDVVPVGSKTNVTATLLEPTTTNFYTAVDLAQPLEGTTTFYSAIWNLPPVNGGTNVYDITFGTDTHLKTGPGWDNVTGLGTPNGAAFANYFNPAVTP